LPVFFPFKNEPELLGEGKLAGGSSFGFEVSDRREVTTSGSFGCGGSALGFGVLFGVEFVDFDFESWTFGGVYLPFVELLGDTGGGVVFVTGGCWGG
jgi:hypothetical protein